MSKRLQIDEIEQAKDEVRAAVASGRVTKAQLAAATGYHRNTMLDMHLPTWNPKTRTLSAILEVVRRRPLARARRGEQRASAA